MNVTVFHESLLKIDPTIAADINPISAVPPTGNQLLVTAPSTAVVTTLVCALNAFIQFSFQ